jgi:hypothetical protein
VVIPHGMVVLVRRLLAEGKLSRRAIARVTGVGRSTIAEIAAGRRRDRAPAQAEEWDLFPEASAVSERCPGCGGRVYMPCRLCYVRELKRLDELGRERCRATAPVSSEGQSTCAGTTPSMVPVPAAVAGVAASICEVSSVH